MSKIVKPEPKEKKYDLKSIELRMLEVMQKRHQEELGNFLTFICVERLAYNVTAQTQFKIEDSTLNVWEDETKNVEEPAPAEEVSVA